MREWGVWGVKPVKFRPFLFFSRVPPQQFNHHRRRAPVAAAMELNDFGSLFAPGYTLSVEERAALEVQMAKKRLEERLHRCGGARRARAPRLRLLLSPRSARG